MNACSNFCDKWIISGHYLLLSHLRSSLDLRMSSGPRSLRLGKRGGGSIRRTGCGCGIILTGGWSKPPGKTSIEMRHNSKHLILKLHNITKRHLWLFLSILDKYTFTGKCFTFGWRLWQQRLWRVLQERGQRGGRQLSLQKRRRGSLGWNTERVRRRKRLQDGGGRLHYVRGLWLALREKDCENMFKSRP